MNGNKTKRLYDSSSKFDAVSFVFFIKLFGLIGYLLAFTNLKSQMVSGTIYNEDHQIVAGALVTIVGNPDDEIISYTITDDMGKFTLKNVPLNKYTLTISALGFFDLKTEVDTSENHNKTYVLTKQHEYTIEEVILAATIPIKIKKDTIELNAKSFLTGNETNVEDLLKNLPGISVDSEGKVRVGGIEVEKIMIENDDFFEKGYTLLTKNMPVAPIDKIQILQRYSNNKHLKEIEHSEKVAINLTLDETTKRAWFGNAILSSSFYPDFFYSAKLNLIKMGRRSKYFLLGSANNNGATTLGDLSHLIKPTNQEEPGFINIKENAYKFGSNLSAHLPFGSEQAKFNNDKLASFNTILTLNDKAKVKLIGFVNRDNLSMMKSTQNQVNFNDVNFINIETQRNILNKQNYFGKINLDYDISKNVSLQYNGNVNIVDLANMQEREFNNLPWKKTQKTTPHSTDQNVLHTYKINEKTVWLNAGRLLNEEVYDDSHSSNFFLADYLNSQDISTSFTQTSNSTLSIIGVISQLLYRTTNDNLLDLSLFSNFKRQSFANIMLAETDENSTLLGEKYQNKIENRQKEFGAKFKYTLDLKKLKISPEIQYSVINNNYTETEEIERTYYLFSPTLSLLWIPHYKGKLNATVFLGQEPIEITEMLPNYFSVDPRYLSRGLSKFTYLKNSGGSVRYSYGDWSDRLFLTLQGSYKNYNEYLSNRLLLNKNYTVAEAVIFDNRDDYILSAEFNYFFKKIKSNLKLAFGKSISYYQTASENNLRNDISTSVQNIGVSIKSGWKKKFNYTIGVSLNDAKVAQEAKQKISSQQAFAEINLRLSDKIDLIASQYHYSFGGYFTGWKNNHFLNTRINYQLAKDTSLSIIGNNLLNQKEYKESIVTETGSNATHYRLLPRYIMLELKFSL